MKKKLDNFPGQPELQWTMRRTISVGEKGQKYTAEFRHPRLSAAYTVDGGIISDRIVQKCDKLILLEDDGPRYTELFVELKGAHISHAIDQLSATLRNPLFSAPTVAVRQARVVGRSIPRNTGNSLTERAKKEFLKKYGCRLEFRTGPCRETID